MAAKRAIVATRVGVIPDILSHQSGRLIPPRDAEAIRAAIAELYNDHDKRRALGHKAKEIARRDYNLDLLGRQLEAVYAHALACFSIRVRG